MMPRYAAFPLLAIPALLPLAGSLLEGATEQPLPAPPPGTIITVAGYGKASFSGDRGAATRASLDNPLDVAMDAAGNLFIADGYNARVRRVSPDGTITTVAGSSSAYGFSGDGGPATQARLAEVAGVAVDPTGGFFISDIINQRVRKVDSAGIITTVAGGGHPADGIGDGGLATESHLVGPIHLAVDLKGDLLIADLWGGRVRKVNPAGVITTVAGGGHPADGNGDGGLAIDARLSTPEGVALDRTGNLLITDFGDNVVRRVSPDGRIATVAGGGNPADGLGDGGPATQARLDGPFGIVVDGGDNFFITEDHGERVRKVSPAGIITTIAGTGEAGYTGDGGPATAARLNSPIGVCIDRAGNLFLAEGNRYTLTPKRDAPLVVKAGNMVVREVIGAAMPR